MQELIRYENFDIKNESGIETIGVLYRWDYEFFPDNGGMLEITHCQVHLFSLHDKDECAISLRSVLIEDLGNVAFFLQAERETFRKELGVTGERKWEDM